MFDGSTSSSTSTSPISKPTQAPAKLATGAIAGIAVGGFAAAVVIVGIIVTIIMHRRRHADSDTSNIPIADNPRFGNTGGAPPINAYASGGPGQIPMREDPALYTMWNKPPHTTGVPAPMGYAPTYLYDQRLPPQQRPISEMMGSPPMPPPAEMPSPEQGNFNAWPQRR
ncbi:MAG: hypothetical protein M1829_001175 [Trizodia sp. TS-e1964]|nr:MAG: hypothetical protein M1829_001175 [Trizodia sp. TS-e1964]